VEQRSGRREGGDRCAVVSDRADASDGATALANTAPMGELRDALLAALKKAGPRQPQIAWALVCSAKRAARRRDAAVSLGLFVEGAAPRRGVAFDTDKIVQLVSIDTLAKMGGRREPGGAPARRDRAVEQRRAEVDRHADQAGSGQGSEVARQRRRLGKSAIATRDPLIEAMKTADKTAATSTRGVRDGIARRLVLGLAR